MSGRQGGNRQRPGQASHTGHRRQGQGHHYEPHQHQKQPPHQQQSLSTGNLPSTASLVENVDKKVIIVLRDGRKLIGYLRSFDQFGNMLIQDTIERIFVGRAYGDIERGIYVVRGESIVLMGELDEMQSATPGLEQVSVEEILARQHDEVSKRQAHHRLRNKILRDRGLQPEAIFEEM